LIEPAVQGLEVADEDGGSAIVMACRRLEAEFELMADEVLPPTSAGRRPSLPTR
jgi:hypothetical protein